MPTSPQAVKRKKPDVSGETEIMYKRADEGIGPYGRWTDRAERLSLNLNKI